MVHARGAGGKCQISARAFRTHRVARRPSGSRCAQHACALSCPRTIRQVRRLARSPSAATTCARPQTHRPRGRVGPAQVAAQGVCSLAVACGLHANLHARGGEALHEHVPEGHRGGEHAPGRRAAAPLQGEAERALHGHERRRLVPRVPRRAGAHVGRGGLLAVLGHGECAEGEGALLPLLLSGAVPGAREQAHGVQGRPHGREERGKRHDDACGREAREV
mmetsp:Transcript_20382/g.68406  ORF Transcript_20382/g.68406 Transcript_20382/m.68406 type:complete len:221 (+) Transcript_20382:238-900(+)